MRRLGGYGNKRFSTSLRYHTLLAKMLLKNQGQLNNLQRFSIWSWEVQFLHRSSFQQRMQNLTIIKIDNTEDRYRKIGSFTTPEVRAYTKNFRMWFIYQSCLKIGHVLEFIPLFSPRTRRKTKNPTKILLFRSWDCFPINNKFFPNLAQWGYLPCWWRTWYSLLKFRQIAVLTVDADGQSCRGHDCRLHPNRVCNCYWSCFSESRIWHPF